MLFRLELPIEKAIEIYPEVLRIFEEDSLEETDRPRDSQKTTFLMNRLRTVFGPLLPRQRETQMLDSEDKSKGYVYQHFLLQDIYIHQLRLRCV